MRCKYAGVRKFLEIETQECNTRMCTFDVPVCGSREVTKLLSATRVIYVPGPKLLNISTISYVTD